jgi:hypothetical protein
MGKSLSPLKTGSSTSIEHPATSIFTPQVKKFDRRTQTRRFEALASIVSLEKSKGLKVADE